MHMIVCVYDDDVSSMWPLRRKNDLRVSKKECRD